MMTDQKGRSGKKPKYQIPDIAGADQTAEDISTERVLNFLIRGEAPSPEQADAPGAAASIVGRSDPSSAPAQAEQNKPSGDSLPSTEPAPKKSLARLFERAKSGGGVAKDLPLQLPPDERVDTPPQSASHSEAIKLSKDTGQVTPQPSAVEAPVTKAVEPSARASEMTALPGPELAQYIELWKNFYRLKAGEVNALRGMYRLSYEQGSDQCYIKMHNLAEMSNLTYRYCQKVVRSLEQLGWITKLKDYDPSDQLGVLYRVNLKPSVPSPELPS